MTNVINQHACHYKIALCNLNSKTEISFVQQSQYRAYTTLQPKCSHKMHRLTIKNVMSNKQLIIPHFYCPTSWHFFFGKIFQLNFHCRFLTILNGGLSSSFITRQLLQSNTIWTQRKRLSQWMFKWPTSIQDTAQPSNTKLHWTQPTN